MATQQPSSGSNGERLELRHSGAGLLALSGTVAAVGLIFAALLGYHKQDQFQQLLYSYLVAYCFFLLLCLGGLFFVILQHTVKAGWSVNVRRIAEWFAAVMPVMAILSVPILLSVLHGDGVLYRWANKDELAKLSAFKQVYFIPAFFVGRMIFYFLIWSIMGLYFWKLSVKQDTTGDMNLTLRMQCVAPPCMVIFALTFTCAMFDLLMSLDPEWGSTIFGVYCFAGASLCIYASITLISLILQSRGYLLQSVTTEHYHDLGKLLFAFTFFYGYIAYDQYMLQWYANLPEETHWYKLHGATTVAGDATGWSWVCLLILFGHILIPFAALLSRHVKRNRTALGFWAAWILIMEWVDVYWLAMPQLRADGPHLDFMDLACFLGIGGLIMAMLIRKASQHSIRPVHDPRLEASMAFENV